MSNNFIGVTFPYQSVTPTDDSVIRQALLPDGILYGCALTYSGNTVCMEPGQLIICGRQIRHTAQSIWSLTDISEGFARIVLTIDLDAESTETVFEQVRVTIEYAESEADFAVVQQDAIYAGGTIYQFELCRAMLAGEILSLANVPQRVGGGSQCLLWDGHLLDDYLALDASKYRFLDVYSRQGLPGLDAYGPICCHRLLADTQEYQTITLRVDADVYQMSVQVFADHLQISGRKYYYEGRTESETDAMIVPIRIYGIL